MHPISAAQKADIISLLTAGHSAHEVSSIMGVHTSTISRLQRKHCPYISMSAGGCPTKLTGRNVQHAICLITSGKVDTAVEVTKALQDVVNQPVSPDTMRRHLKKAGMKAVVKKKKPFLSAKHVKVIPSLYSCSVLSEGIITKGSVLSLTQTYAQEFQRTSCGIEPCRTLRSNWGNYSVRYWVYICKEESNNTLPKVREISGREIG